MISGEKLMIYLGVALMLHGTYITLADTNTALGGFFSAMGLVMSYVGIMGRDKVAEKFGFVVAPVCAEKHPLAYHAALIEGNVENQRKSSGNKALGLVLISVGTLTVTLAGLYPFFLYLISGWPDIISDFGFLLLLWISPLSMFGIICLSFGMIFRRIAHR